MPTRTIDIKGFLGDLDAGASHTELMQKYRLSDAELSSLLRQLAAKGHLDAAHRMASSAQTEEIFRINSRTTGDVLFEATGPSMAHALASAVRAKVFLGKAELPAVSASGLDLTSARLPSSNLAVADFRNSVLENADLGSADLTEADLSRAILRGADLTGAKLARAKLQTADLTGANLTGANLREADLFKANLANADLTGADLSHADMRYCNLEGANLTGAVQAGARLEGAGSLTATRDRTAEKRRERKAVVASYFASPAVVWACQAAFMVLQVMVWRAPWYVRLAVWLFATIFSLAKFMEHRLYAWLHGAGLQSIFYWLDIFFMILARRLF